VTNKIVSSAFALIILLIALPAPAPAGPADSGSRPPAPASRPAPAFRPAPAPVSRPAPPPPQARPAPPSGGGFNFEHDINARPAPVTQQRPFVAPPQRPVVAPEQRPVAPQPQQLQQRPQNRPVVTYPRAPNTNSSGGPYRGRFTGPIVRNAHAPSGTWGWNHGVAWRPAPVYWGGGFWGPFSIAAQADALLFGSIIDDQNQLIYPSYQIQPDTPGADLLADYELQQTPCGPPNLVVIWGPDNSVICAIPNDTVGPGDYQVDPSTFTLVPAAQ
jgi:hypothetical protein